LWIIYLPNESREIGYTISGAGKYAYTNANNYTKFSLLKLNIETVELSSVIAVLMHIVSRLGESKNELLN